VQPGTGDAERDGHGLHDADNEPEPVVRTALGLHRSVRARPEEVPLQLAREALVEGPVRPSAHPSGTRPPQQFSRRSGTTNHAGSAAITQVKAPESARATPLADDLTQMFLRPVPCRMSAPGRTTAGFGSATAPLIHRPASYGNLSDALPIVNDGHRFTFHGSDVLPSEARIAEIPMEMRTVWAEVGHLSEAFLVRSRSLPLHLTGSPSRSTLGLAFPVETTT